MNMKFKGFFLIVLMVFLMSCDDRISNTTQNYYIDYELGSDSNSGRKPKKAWKTLALVNSTTFKAGDIILFRANQTWHGTLFLKGSGSKEKPIRVDKYGEGKDPIINGNGLINCSNQDNIEHYCTIFLYNQEYWQISNLEITNYNSSEEMGLLLEDWETQNSNNYAEAFHPKQYKEKRLRKSGILVYARDHGAVKNLHFRNLHIHGVNGDITTKNNGGIFLRIFGNETETPTYFDDLLIEGCHIHDVDRTGVSNVSYYNKRTIDSTINWTPSLHYVIRNNTFEKTGANALIFRVAKKPLVEYNVFDHCAIKESGNAFFNFNTDDAILQYNESRFTKYNINDHDAGGIDSDFRTKNTILQYNYIHDNDFGPLITGGQFKSGGFNDSTIVRYNIFKNDGIARDPSDGKINWTFKVSGNATNTYVHNNLFLLSDKQQDRAIIYHKNWGAYPDKTTYFNNIIINNGVNNYYEFTKSTNNYLTHNAIQNNPEKGSISQFNVIEDDLLTEHFQENVYRLMPSSKLITGGARIIEMPETDYYGAPILSATPIGISIGN